jgi:hypothetical protein
MVTATGEVSREAMISLISDSSSRSKDMVHSP